VTRTAALTRGLLAVAALAGTASDVRGPAVPPVRGGYRVMAGDFHVHAFLGDGVLWPWDIVLEARHRGLHVLALTNHNQVLAARIGRWSSRLLGGPLVLVGEEITAPGHHLVAVGIETTVDWRQPAARAIDAVHAQGGVAIAAHPVPGYDRGYDADALRRLDGTEIVQPMARIRPGAGAAMRLFRERARALGEAPAPIGSSDFHAMPMLGASRTYVFVEGEGEAAVLAALRARRTVVYDEAGGVHGDPRLAALLEDLPRPEEPGPRRLLAGISAACGLLGLLLLGAAARG
jgi:hypothetical protein